MISLVFPMVLLGQTGEKSVVSRGHTLKGGVFKKNKAMKRLHHNHSLKEKGLYGENSLRYRKGLEDQCPRGDRRGPVSLLKIFTVGTGLGRKTWRENP